MVEIFTPKVKKSRLHEDFVKYQQSKDYYPARVLINEIFNKMQDKDGNFEKDFQSGGFYSRLFELFMFEFLNENQFIVLNNYDRPDFHVLKNELEIFIEASTSNLKIDEDKFTNEKILNALTTKDKSFEADALKQYTHRIGSVLYTKLNKKYWELEWVKNKPIFITISAQHHCLARFLPDYLIFEYLYGIKIETESVGEQIVSNMSKITEHFFGEKRIPSNFFAQPMTENISGVIFVNSSDFDKFNRMGYEKGYSDEKIIMVRAGNSYSNHSKAQKFMYDVIHNKQNETWAEGIRILHNPNALFPVSTDTFKNVAQTWITKDGEIKEIMPNFHPFNSITGIFRQGI